MAEAGIKEELVESSPATELLLFGTLASHDRRGSSTLSEENEFIFPGAQLFLLLPTGWTLLCCGVWGGQTLEGTKHEGKQEKTNEFLLIGRSHGACSQRGKAILEFPAKAKGLAAKHWVFCFVFLIPSSFYFIFNNFSFIYEIMI